MSATQSFHHDYPYRLRIQHPEYAEIRVERKGRFLRVDPFDAPHDDEIVVLTSPAPHRARATVEALREGRRLTVIAAPPVLDWLARAGSVDGHAFPHTVDGVTVDGMAYTAPTQARPLAQLLRASVIGARPGASLRRLAEQARAPAVDPHIVSLAFAADDPATDGGRLLHLDLALYRDADPAWVERAAARFGGAEWLLAGFAWGEGDGVLTHVGRFGAKRVLVTELVNAERREMGLPTELVTPVRDRLAASGIEAHVFATQASYRFE
jgi:hypothetical protein